MPMHSLLFTVGSVTCILRWASYNEKPSCTDQINSSCSIHDCMFEESVCLLLGTSWFEASDEVEEDTLQYEYDDELDDLDESYYVTSKSSIHIGNRRWGDNGYVKAGRKAARPVLYRYDDRCRSKEERSTKGCHWQKGEKGPEARCCREGCRRQAPAAFAEAGPLVVVSCFNVYDAASLCIINQQHSVQCVNISSIMLGLMRRTATVHFIQLFQILLLHHLVWVQLRGHT